MTFSYDDIVPTQVQDELMHWSEDIDKNEWKIGNRAVELIDENEHRFKKKDVCAAMSLYSKGIPEATIADYEYTSRHTPEGVRGEYMTLGRHHFKAVIPHAKNPTHFRAILNGWLSDESTTTESVKSLRAYLDPDKDNSLWIRVLKETRGKCKKLEVMNDAPLEVRRAARSFLLATEAVQDQQQSVKPG